MRATVIRGCDVGSQTLPTAPSQWHELKYGPAGAFAGPVAPRRLQQQLPAEILSCEQQQHPAFDSVAGPRAAQQLRGAVAPFSSSDVGDRSSARFDSTNPSSVNTSTVVRPNSRRRRPSRAMNRRCFERASIGGNSAAARRNDSPFRQATSFARELQIGTSVGMRIPASRRFLTATPSARAFRPVSSPSRLCRLLRGAACWPRRTTGRRCRGGPTAFSPRIFRGTSPR